MTGLEERPYQVMAFLLSPFAIIVLIALTKAFYQVVQDILASWADPSYFGWLASILALVAFIGGIWAIYKWVRSGGKGVLQ